MRTSVRTPECTSAAANPITFNYLSNTVRVVEIDGNSWSVAKEPCYILGLGNTSMACRALRDDKKRVVSRSTNSNLFELGRGSSRLILISESGLYKLIHDSDKPETLPFQDCVTRDVLPAIRKDGMYGAAQFGRRHRMVLDTFEGLRLKTQPQGGFRRPSTWAEKPATSTWLPTSGNGTNVLRDIDVLVSRIGPQALSPN